MGLSAFQSISGGGVHRAARWSWLAVAMIVMVLSAAMLVSSSTKAEASAKGWCTPIPQGQSCFDTAYEACYAEWQYYSPAEDFYGYRDTGKWSVENCVWTHNHIDSLPGQVSFGCTTLTEAAFPPGFCIALSENRPLRDCDCGTANHGATANPTTPYPININTGAKRFEATDFATADGALNLRRQYASLPYLKGGTINARPLGLANWHFDFEYELHIGQDWPGGHKVYLPAPDGSSYGFVRQSDGSMLRSTTSPPQTDYTIAFVGTWPSDLSTLINSPSTWTMRDPRDNVWTLQTKLDPSTSKYDIARPTSVTMHNGLQLTFTYGGQGELASVTDSYGKTITFTWVYTGVNSVYPKAITGAALPDGTKLKYSYGTIGNGGPNPQPDRLSEVQHLDAMDNVLDQTSYEYGNASFPFFITGILDKNGVERWSVTYDSVGRATLSEGPSGAYSYSVAYAPASSTFAHTVTNPLGKQTAYNYVAHSTPYYDDAKVSSVAAQASALTPASTYSYAYDTNSFISQTTDEEGRITKYTRNTRGLPTQIIEGYGTSVARTTNITWDSTRALPTEIQGPDLTTDYTYDSNGNVSTLTETDTTTTSMPYSTNGQARTWTYTWSSTGQLLTIDGPLSGTGDTVTYTYDTNGYLATITNELSQVTTISSVNGRGQPTAVTDPNGIETDLTYDLLGRLTSIAVDPSASDAVTSFEYNVMGDITKITEPNGAYLQYTYDDARRVTAVKNNLSEEIDYTYNNAGSVTETDVKTSGGTITATQSKTYDDLNRLLQKIGAATQTTNYGYDKTSNLTSVTDPRSKVYSFAFDALSRLQQETDPDTYQTNTGYNGKDEVTSVTDARSLATSYVRDGFGDVIQQTSPDTGTTVYYYDAAGRMTESLDARSVETDYTYDNLGRVLTKSFPSASGEDVTYTYDDTTGGNDGIGHLTSMADGSGSTSFTYNALGQTASVMRVVGSNSYTTTYAYDLSGNVTQITYPSGRIVLYTRDSVGHITDIGTKADAMSTEETVISGAAYNPFGPLTGLTFGNAVALSQTYDEDGQLTGIQASLGTTTIQDLTYGYDDSGNITGITDNYQSARSQTLGYDNLNRLNAATGAYGTLAFTYDGVGNRTSRTIGSTTEAYAYDAASNRVTGSTIGGTGVRSFSYLDAGQISEDIRDASNTYDFTYNANGRLLTASLNSSMVGTYSYNALEQRVAKTAGSTTTQYVYAPTGEILSENDGSGNPIREYIWMGAMPVAVIDHTGMSPVTYYIHADHLGRPQKMTDASAAIVWDAVYDPFGNPYSVSGTATNLLMFPGQIYDSETALSQNWHRDYDPSLGRYIESDPIGLQGGVNTYAYVDGNPIESTDPAGECPWCVPVVIGGAFGAGTDIVVQLVNNGNNWRCINWWEVGESAVEGAGLATIGEFAVAGREISIGKNFRIAPFGNRTGDELGKWPHYHRRGVDPETGNPRPGQGIGRHRPWETKEPDKSIWDRF